MHVVAVVAGWNAWLLLGKLARKLEARPRRRDSTRMVVVVVDAVIVYLVCELLGEDMREKKDEWDLY